MMRRHTQTVSGCDSASDWLTQVSSPSLRSRGFAGNSLDEAQVKLWSEKLSNLLRRSSELSAEAQHAALLSFFFAVEDTTKFCGPVSTFREAMVVVLHCEEFEDLDDRCELLQDAMNTIDARIPNAILKQEGSALGATLDTYVSGKRIVSKGRSCLVSAKVARQELARFFDHFNRFKPLFDATVGCFLTPSECIFASMREAGLKLGKSYSEDLKSVPPCIMPSPTTPQLCETMSAFCPKRISALSESCVRSLLRPATFRN